MPLFERRNEICLNTGKPILPFITISGDLTKEGSGVPIDVDLMEIEQVGPDHQFIGQEEEDFSEPPVIVVPALEGSNQAIEVDDHAVQVRVFVKGQFYKVESNTLLEAVDACYNSMRIFNCGFPAECKHCWSFFHKAVYDQPKGSYDYRVVTDFIEELKKIQ